LSDIADTGAPPVVEFVRVSKTFGTYRAVIDISLQIRKGEFFSLLGPSGCGKTTTLRLIAGFEEPDPNGGEVRIHGEVVNKKKPYDRNLAMVFQNYALFPHMTVEGNIAFGLEMRGTPKSEIPDRVRRAMAMVRMDPDQFGRRAPAQLSGGQRQRVALARALVLEPQILLLDEPLGALDLKLRKEMQLELKQLNRELGTTFIYVTHDQEEALTMSDRIAVMANSRLAQLGSPAETYECPRTEFVARFIGESNFFDGVAVDRQDAHWDVVTAAESRFRIPHHPAVKLGQRVQIAVRPEWLDVCRPDEVPDGENALLGSVHEIIYLGETLHVLVSLPGERRATVAVRNEGQLARPITWRKGDVAAVAWKPEDCQVLEAD
jgi:spermidine/putrescine transport system ATP-binding protein